MNAIRRMSLISLLVVGMLPNSPFNPRIVSAAKPELAAQDLHIKDAIVKIYTVADTPDYHNPWRMQGAYRAYGSGCIISGNRILTNAHVVANQTFIQVRLHGDAKRYNAAVQQISHDADLALLTVEDEAFFEGVTPLEFGELPETQDEVIVYGFPLGGDSLSITKGVLSRLEHTYYTHSSHFLLAGQIDAAINPGNSGGPVISNGKIVGVVMQGMKARDAENIGYMVPITVVAHFFDDLNDGRYDGFPNIGVSIQTLENPDMKLKYGLRGEQTGILINRIYPGSPAETLLKRGDILLAVEGHAIADDGTIEFRPKERTSLMYYVDQHHIGETVSLEIFRDGKAQPVTLALSRTRGEYKVVPPEQYEQTPRYFIYGGIVFTPLTKNLLTQYGSNWPQNAPDYLLAELDKPISDTRQEVVLALKVLAADVNQGYHDLFAWMINDVNGKTFKNFDEFYRLVMESNEPYLALRDEEFFELVLDRKKAEAAHQDILNTYRIEHDRSPDLRPQSEASGE